MADLQDEEHGSSDGDRQQIKRICCCQVVKPEQASCLKTGHRQVGHLPQSNEERDEDWRLGEQNTIQKLWIIRFQTLKHNSTNNIQLHFEHFQWFPTCAWEKLSLIQICVHEKTMYRKTAMKINCFDKLDIVILSYLIVEVDDSIKASVNVQALQWDITAYIMTIKT